MKALLLLFAIREAVGSWGHSGTSKLVHKANTNSTYQLKACFEVLAGPVAKQITQKEHIFSCFLINNHFSIHDILHKIFSSLLHYFVNLLLFFFFSVLFSYINFYANEMILFHVQTYEFL